jgi:hypothetical protein
MVIEQEEFSIYRQLFHTYLQDDAFAERAHHATRPYMEHMSAVHYSNITSQDDQQTLEEQWSQAILMHLELCHDYIGLFTSEHINLSEHVRVKRQEVTQAIVNDLRDMLYWKFPVTNIVYSEAVCIFSSGLLMLEGICAQDILVSWLDTLEGHLKYAKNKHLKAHAELELAHIRIKS